MSKRYGDVKPVSPDRITKSERKQIPVLHTVKTIGCEKTNKPCLGGRLLAFGLTFLLWNIAVSTCVFFAGTQDENHNLRAPPILNGFALTCKRFDFGSQRRPKADPSDLLEAAQVCQGGSTRPCTFVLDPGPEWTLSPFVLCNDRRIGLDSRLFAALHECFQNGAGRFFLPRLKALGSTSQQALVSRVRRGHP